MIKQVRIQNFKSLKDVVIDIEDVNLFIGPNNSGKSNVFKAISYFSDVFNSSQFSNLSNISFQKNAVTDPLPVAFTIIFDFGNKYWLYKLELYDSPINSFIELSASFEKEKVQINEINLFEFEFFENKLSEYVIQSNNKNFKNKNFKKEYDPLFNTAFLKYKINNKTDILQSQYSIGNSDNFVSHAFYNIIEEFFSSTIIYKPDISMIQLPNKSNRETLPLDFLEEDCDNLADFLFNFSQNHKKRFDEFLNDFKTCVSDFTDISTPYDPTDKNKSSLKIKFFDKFDNGYWIDEVSDGVIYFLALLAIIHQPNPPRLLLLEEPETGIHPRRIKEIADYIFKLSEEKGIQVIMTSHSPLLLEKFNSIPQNVFVFDKENASTIIKNLKKDIIEINNENLKKVGLDEINYTSSLGEYWLDGFIGGIPDETN